MLINVLLAGICNTDLEITAGYLDFQGVLGHEFVGVVPEDPEGSFTGKRVVGSINIPCGECTFCREGIDNHCAHMKTIGINGKDGAFAEYLSLPRENIYLIPESISDEKAVFVEPLAAGVQIAQQVHLKPEDEVVVLGDGKLGLLAAFVLQAMSIDVKVIGKHNEKLKIAGSMGIETYLLGEYEKPVDVIVECTGSNSGLDAALSLVKPKGTIILKTTTTGKYKLDLSRIVINEIKIIGSRCGPFKPALNLIERNSFPLQDMIDSIFSIDDGIEAFRRAKESGVLKVLIKMGAGRK